MNEKDSFSVFQTKWPVKHLREGSFGTCHIHLVQFEEFFDLEKMDLWYPTEI
jgi:hypothetical protein